MPRAVVGELVRDRLLKRLSSRWTDPVTTLVAPAGFGKSTLLAQMVRVNDGKPNGLEYWISCRPADCDPRHFAQKILTALDNQDPTGSSKDPAEQIVHSLRAANPLDVCLIIDDVHELGDDTDSTRLLAKVLRQLPANAHVVLSGRRMPKLPLARLRAGDAAKDLTQSDLAFNAEEVDALASQMGGRFSTDADVGGWPALVRLSIVAGSSSPLDYLQEEVLETLDDRRRVDLLALTLFDVATSEEVEAVTGSEADLFDLARSVPMIDELGDGQFRAHGLWTEATARLFAPGFVESVQRTTVEYLLAADRMAEAGQLSVKSQAWDLLATAGASLVSASLSSTPLDLAESWLAAVPEDKDSYPGLLLLRAAVAWGRSYGDAEVDRLTDAAFDALGKTGRLDHALAALGLAVVAAESRADLGRIWELVQRSSTIVELESSPLVSLLRHASTAVLAELSGNPEAALVALGHVDTDEVPWVLTSGVHRLKMHCLIMAGCADDVIPVVEGIERNRPHGEWPTGLAIARWFAGDASRYQEVLADPSTPSGDRDDFRERSVGAILRACGGHIPPTEPELDPEVADNSREAALLTAVAAVREIMVGYEGRSVDIVQRFLDRYPLSDRLGERHLRRFLAIHYVLNPEVRELWDQADLGPAHQRCRTIARSLVNLRSGTSASGLADITPEQIFCTIPLPWSVELAARLSAADHPLGIDLAQWLADFLGPVAIDEIYLLADAGDGRDSVAVAGAQQLARALPATPQEVLRVNVLGTFSVSSRSVASDERPELRRRRVREVLGALLVYRSLSRDQLIEFFWPDFEVVKAQRNLRVTLSYLRRLLEPDRRPGEQGCHLRVEGDRVELVESTMLDIDLWRFEALLDKAEKTDQNSSQNTSAKWLKSALEVWEGRPAPELWSVAEVAAPMEALCLRWADAALLFGEHLFAEDRIGEVSELVAAVMADQPYNERALRLGLATALRAGDPELVSHWRYRLTTCLKELGAEPDLSARILLSKAESLAS